MKILVAEDNITNQKLIQKILEKGGFQPEIVKNGLEVLEKLESETFDVILMDLHMPEMDGIECSREIRKKYGNDVKIIALTADAFEETQQDCLDVGMNGFLSKPFNVKNLLDMIGS